MMLRYGRKAIVGMSPVVIITLSEVFDGTIPSKHLFPFPWNLYLKTDGTSLLIFFLVKNFEEKEIEWWYQLFIQVLFTNLTQQVNKKWDNFLEN